MKSQVAIVVVMLLCFGCGVSKQFRQDAAYAYNLLMEAKEGKPVRQADFVQAMAKAKATATSSEDQVVIEKLTSLGALVKNIDAADKLDKALFDSCAREVSYRLGIDPKPKLDLCDKLGALRTERDRILRHCQDSDPEIKKLYKQRLQIDVAKRSKEWLEVSKKMSDRTAVVENDCRARITPAYEQKLPALFLGQ